MSENQATPILIDAEGTVYLRTECGDVLSSRDIAMRPGIIAAGYRANLTKTEATRDAFGKMVKASVLTK